MATKPERSFLDGPGARVVALLCLLGSASVLAYLHREQLWPAAEAPAQSAEEAAYLACVDERAAHIDKMLKDGVVKEAQASLFRSRAEALCRDQTGGSAGPPPLPGINR